MKISIGKCISKTKSANIGTSIETRTKPRGLVSEQNQNINRNKNHALDIVRTGSITRVSTNHENGVGVFIAT